MCGIAAILSNVYDKTGQQQAIKGMISSLLHRGPDEWGVYYSDNIALGHTRLSIIDLSSGHQPMKSENCIICYNGEVYNYLELREELEARGVTFKTHCDTEIVLKAYEIYGSECFKKFNGQFAILIWDKQNKKLIAARDRYGIRPLYVLNYNNSYFFASELKAFDKIEGYKREFNHKNLAEHSLLWNTLSNKTVFKNIHSVKAGSFEIYTDLKYERSELYYELGETNDQSKLSFPEAQEEFLSLLNDSISLRLRSDVPVGAYLSGGIDSSVITYLTSKIKKEKLKSFSVSFSDSEFDESSYQSEMVNHINSSHENVNITYEDINNNFFNAAYHFERPVFRTAPVPLFLLSKKVQENGIKVVLTGEAADEILFGYDSFKELVLLSEWEKNPESGSIDSLISQLYPHLLHYKNPKQFGFIKMYYEGFLKDYNNDLASLNIRISNNRIIQNFLNKDLAVEYTKEELIAEARQGLPEEFPNWSLLQKNQYMEMKSLLQGYLLSSQGDRMSMAHSVEGRYPFLDHRLVEKTFFFNDSFKLNGFKQKHLLRETFRELLPPSIIDRPKKPYTAPDLKSFFKDGKLTEKADFFINEDMINKYGTYDWKMVNRFIRKFSKGIPGEIGYRDNMIISFILSSQMINYWIDNPRENSLNESLKTVEIHDYQ